MTKTRRVINILQGLVMLALALLIAINPIENISGVLWIIGAGFTLRAAGLLIYYLRMARHMVGGRLVLYRSIIFFDVGILTSSISDAPTEAVVIYVVAINIFSGVVSILRSRESRGIGSPIWKNQMLSGALIIVMAVAALIAGLAMGRTEYALYIYVLGLIISAASRFATAFRRVRIAYIP